VLINVQDLYSLALGDIVDGGPKQWTAFVAIAHKFLNRSFMKLTHTRSWSNWPGGCVVSFLREKPDVLNKPPPTHLSRMRKRGCFSGWFKLASCWLRNRGNVSMKMAMILAIMKLMR
jgi:hypothetical protein